MQQNVNEFMPYLYNADDKEVEVGDTPKLFKQVLGQKIPGCVLKTHKNLIS